jgi:hypothetical protein
MYGKKKRSRITTPLYLCVTALLPTDELSGAEEKERR